MDNSFVAIDVETANSDMSSICQIGLAVYEDGKLSDAWMSYVNPQDYFHQINVSIHGIDESTVQGSPLITDVAEQLCKFLDDRVVVCHTRFDRVAIRQAFDKHGLRKPRCLWLDSARVARRAWIEFAWRGYGLYNICSTLGYDFRHHDALEDAKAAGHILLSAMARLGLDVKGCLKRVEQPINPAATGVQAIRLEGNPDGPLYGEVLVFTGALQIPRREAAAMAAKMGCRVATGVTNKTSILVVGDQDIQRLAGHKKAPNIEKQRNWWLAARRSGYSRRAILKSYAVWMSEVGRLV